MALVRPRLNDFYDLPFTQEEVDFAVPFLDEDIPLYLDPFLLWRSPSLQDNSLHTAVVNSFNHIGYLVRNDDESEAISMLIAASECREAGLGMSKDKRGLRIGHKTAAAITAVFKDIPQVRRAGFTHFEEIQLLVANISKDRVSDIACSFLKSFLVDFTIEQSEKYGIPLKRVTLHNMYDYRTNRFAVEEGVYLPHNPETNEPIVLIPKRWLRLIPWINYDDYFHNYYICEASEENLKAGRVAILNFNRHDYDLVATYTEAKERTQADCRNDPLFCPIPVRSAKRKLSTILAIPPGKTDRADQKYEDHVCQLMASLFYPNLDFAAEQSRTDSGVLIRDLIFYNSRNMDFLRDIHSDYGSRQLVLELKNVKEVEREHINQLNRYLGDQFGRFGVIVTRTRLPRRIFRNTVDLWSGQRKCIIALTDDDLTLMVSVYESKQRLPIEVLKRKYVEFARACPS